MSHTIEVINADFRSPYLSVTLKINGIGTRLEYFGPYAEPLGLKHSSRIAVLTILKNHQNVHEIAKRFGCPPNTLSDAIDHYLEKYSKPRA